jgi:hypothetical protein
MTFQYYPAHVNSKRPIGQVTLKEFIGAVKNPSDRIREVFVQIAAAELSGDMELKAKLKQENLYYFTPCVFTDWQGRSYSNVKSFTGLAVLDFDHIDRAAELRNFLFENYKCICAAFISSSKRGVKCLVKIPIATSIEDFKAYFYGLGHYFDKYQGFDGTPQNSVLPLFLSHDPDLLYRDDPETWEQRGTKLNSFTVSNDALPIDFKVREGDSERIYKNIKKAFDAIISNGHPQVIAACVSLGGYVGAGYISQHEGEQIAFNLIETNNYLRKGVGGYKKTAVTAIQTGMKSNLILNN